MSSGSCPSDVRSLHYFPKYVGTNCQFNWTNRAAMIEKVRDRMKHRHKLFLRFNAPVFYLDSDWTWKQSQAEFDTWVWVAVTHEYMLHFPHNFNVLSLGTMGIITNNFWGPGGEGEIHGYCYESCLELGKTTTPRCTLTWKDLSEFMSNVTAEGKTEWNYVCHQVIYVTILKSSTVHIFTLLNFIYAQFYEKFHLYHFCRFWKWYLGFPVNLGTFSYGFCPVLQRKNIACSEDKSIWIKIHEEDRVWPGCLCFNCSLHFTVPN
jgi:hypothetical protein